MTSTCCNTARARVDFARGVMGHAARKASRLDHPRYVEAANQAKAEYIRARDEQMAHVADHDRVDA